VREEGRRAALAEVEFWCRQHTNGPEIVAEFQSLGSF
jgi:hypothetical protein